MPTRIERLLQRQQRRIQKLTDRQARAILRTFDEARRTLREDLERLVPDGDEGLGATPWTAQRTRVALALSERAIRDMTARLGPLFSEGIQALSEQSFEDMLAVIGMHEPDFLLTGSDVNFDALQRITERNGLALHRYSLERYGADTIEQVQRRIAVGVARGDSQRTIREAIAGVDGVVARYGRPRAALITQMELSRAYNDAHVEAIGAWADATPDAASPPLRMIIEVGGGKTDRSHAASEVAHGMTAPVGEPFELPAADILRVMRRTRPKTTRVTGMTWEREGDAYVGYAPPIHYRDRARVVPWRASWGDPPRNPIDLPPLPEDG